MFEWFTSLFDKRDLKSQLRETRKVRIKGIDFLIKKISPYDYLEGSKVMVSTYETYEEKRKKDKAESMSESDLKKIKAHMGDVILAGVAEPKIGREKSDDTIGIEELFADWGLVADLYEEIMGTTYGKKKVKKSQLGI